LGLKNSGRSSKVVVIQRLCLKNEINFGKLGIMAGYCSEVAINTFLIVDVKNKIDLI
jgi:hypothetical protein